MEHCDKGPLIEQLREDSKETHKKLDKVIDVLSAVAVQGERVTTLEKKTDDQEARIRTLEPLLLVIKIVKWAAGIFGSLGVVYLTYLLGLKG